MYDESVPKFRPLLRHTFLLPRPDIMSALFAVRRRLLPALLLLLLNLVELLYMRV
jgi:hypothetical protein